MKKLTIVIISIVILSTFLLPIIIISNKPNKTQLDKYIYPWYKVKSFRNMIAHEYFNIKLPAVWHIIEKDLQELKGVIQTILNNEF